MNRVVKVEAVAPSTLMLTFLDGRRATIDVAALFTREAFVPLTDPGYFAQAEVDPDLGGIFWPNGADLAPDVLHDRIRITA